MVEQLDLESRVKALESQLGKLNDIEEIKETKRKYWYCLDCLLWKELENVFAKDAEIDYGFGLHLKGNRLIARSLKLLTQKQFSVTVHQGHNPKIELIDNRHARGQWQLDQFGIENNCPVRIGGRYIDDYVREDGVWKIKNSKVVYSYWQVMPPKELKTPNPGEAAYGL